MHRKGIIAYYGVPQCQQTKIIDVTEGIVGGCMVRYDLCVGACIEYKVRKKSSRVFFDEIDLVAWPTLLTVDTLLLLHQSLEICLYCMPQGSVADGVFEHIMYLYEKCPAIFDNSALFKKIFLCKLFALLGLHPHDTRFRDQFFEHLVSKSFDNLWYQPAIIADEREIDRWLMVCIASHVPLCRLKAMQLDKLIGVV